MAIDPKKRKREKELTKKKIPERLTEEETRQIQAKATPYERGKAAAAGGRVGEIQQREREQQQSRKNYLNILRKSGALQAGQAILDIERKQAGGKSFEDLQKQKQLKEAAPEQLEQAGAFEEVTPRRQELSPEKMVDIPVIDPIAGALSHIALQRKAKKAGVALEGFEDLGVSLTPREVALNEIRDEALKEGISFSEGFGTFIESIPLVGSLASKYAGGLIETPSSNADEVIAEINKVKEAASTGQEKVRNGLEDPDYGIDRARSMEGQVAKLEGRIKTLINSSPILRANTDEVNKIEEQILEAKEKIARYKRASSFGLTAQITDTGRVIPTDEQLFFELQRLSQ